MSEWHGGKGSKPRPTDTKKYQDNWDRIFNKNKPVPCDQSLTQEVQNGISKEN